MGVGTHKIRRQSVNRGDWISQLAKNDAKIRERVHASSWSNPHHDQGLQAPGKYSHLVSNGVNRPRTKKYRQPYHNVVKREDEATCHHNLYNRGYGSEAAQSNIK